MCACGRVIDSQRDWRLQKSPISLRKRPIIIRNLLIVATPYHTHDSHRTHESHHTHHVKRNVKSNYLTWSHIAHISMPCRAPDLTTRIRMSHARHIHESCAPTTKSWATYQRVMSHTSARATTQRISPRTTRILCASGLRLSPRRLNKPLPAKLQRLLRGTWLIHTTDMTYLYVCNDSCKEVTWRIYVSRDVFMCHVTCSCVTWRVHVSDTSPTRVWYDSWVTCVVWYDSWVTCDMTHSHQWHDFGSFLCVDRLRLDFANLTFQKVIAFRKSKLSRWIFDFRVLTFWKSSWQTQN